MARCASFLASLAVLAAVTAAAHAEDAKTYTVRLRDRWKAGDVVTRTGTIVDRQAVQVTLANGQVAKDQTTETKTTYVRVEKCLEADAQGHLLKGLVHFQEWSQVAGTEKDESLRGVTVELSGRGAARTWKAVSPGAKPSGLASGWIEGQPGLASDDDVTTEMLEPKAPVAVGATWSPDKAAYFAEMAKGMALDPARSEITEKFEAVEGALATLRVDLEVASKGLPNTSTGALFPWLEGGTLTISMHWSRSLDGTVGAGGVTADSALSGVAQAKTGAKVRYDKREHQEMTVKPGGQLPAVR